MNTNAICKQMLWIQRELDDLLARNPDAPDGGPNADRHEALEAEWATLAEALTKATPPTTRKSTRLLAEVAVTLNSRTSEGNLCPESFGDWLKLFALTTAAGKPEKIPLPQYLPIHWPERAC